MNTIPSSEATHTPEDQSLSRKTRIGLVAGAVTLAVSSLWAGSDITANYCDQQQAQARIGSSAGTGEICDNANAIRDAIEAPFEAVATTVGDMLKDMQPKPLFDLDAMTPGAGVAPVAVSSEVA
jgi:hypothetical protein